MAYSTTTQDERLQRQHTRPSLHDVRRDPAYYAFWLLRIGFFAAPVLFGIDKFFNWMVDWKEYLWAGIPDHLPWTATQIMYGVGVVEIIAGFVVLVMPRVGSLLVAGWLGAIIVNLVLVGFAEDEYWDIALRDFGLFIGAVSLFLLATKYSRRHVRDDTVLAA